MAELIAIGYPDQTTAGEAKAEAERLASELIIEPDAIAAISRDTEGKFQLRPALPPRVAAAVDLTDDGRLDLLALSDAGQPVQLTNRGTKAYHWQVVRPYASKKPDKKADTRMNSFAVGSEIEVRIEE